jgi:hypothetical protein
VGFPGVGVSSGFGESPEALVSSSVFSHVICWELSILDAPAQRNSAIKAAT